MPLRWQPAARPWLDSYERFNPYLGPVIRGYRDWANREAPACNGAADEARERSLNDFLGGSGLPSEPRPASPADRGGRVTQPIPDRFGAAAGDGDANARLAASLENLATAMRARGQDLGRSTGALAIPTARPNLEGPVREESERAASAAEAAGQRITGALSVTVAPTVDTSSIRSAQAEVNRLQQSLAGLPGAAQRAAELARRAAVDYSGNQADLED